MFGNLFLAKKAAIIGVAAFAGLILFPTNATAQSQLWSGPYIGLQAGYGIGNFEFDATPFAGPKFKQYPDGFVGGLLAGWNVQFGNLVFGVEADASYSSASHTQNFGNIGFPTITVETKIEGFYTVRGRVGYAFGNWLPFVTGGGGFLVTETRQKLGPPFLGFQQSETHAGYVVGGGLEWALGNNYSFRGEYLYGSFDNRNLGSGFAFLKPVIHVIRVAAILRF